MTKVSITLSGKSSFIQLDLRSPALPEPSIDQSAKIRVIRDLPRVVYSLSHRQCGDFPAPEKFVAPAHRVWAVLFAIIRVTCGYVSRAVDRAIILSGWAFGLNSPMVSRSKTAGFG